MHSGKQLRTGAHAAWYATSAYGSLTVAQVKHYPADYVAPNVLSVAATSITTPAGNYWSMSNPEYLATWSDYGRCGTFLIRGACELDARGRNSFNATCHI